MEEQPGLKGMKKRLTGDHKAAVRTRTDEAAKLFEQITELISCSEEGRPKPTAGRRCPGCGRCLPPCGILMPRFSAKKKGAQAAGIQRF